MSDFVNAANGIVWSPVLVYLLLGVGLYFSLSSGFLQVRHLREMTRLIFQKKSTDSGVSSFQALAMTLAGRVGTGNIAGVATAITFGGPGAVFWMWMVAFLGASSAFVESTLGQIYKEKLNGQYRGGPAFYIEKGLGMKRFATLFAIVTIVAVGLFMPGTQSNSISSAMDSAFGISPNVTAALLAILMSFIILGGVKRIATFASVVVPFMAQAYVIVALVIIGLHIEELPTVIKLIVSSAFGVDAGFGAMLGIAIQWGVKRGVYSNEAGQGTGPHASSAASVSHPAKQGLVQAFSVYVDTLFICSATAFMLLITGRYNVQGPDGSAIYTGIAGVAAGPGYTQVAMEGIMPGFGSSFVAIALFFFAFTTILAYYYIAETNIAYLNRGRERERAWMMGALKLGVIAATAYGAVKTADLAWGLGDLGVGLMAWLNVVAMLLMHKPAFRVLRDYEAQRAQGLDPVFHPEKLGITNADYWTQGRAEANLREEQAADAELATARPAAARAG